MGNSTDAVFCSQSTWTADALSRRLDEWREVFAQWSEGELFTGEAGEAVEASALAEASREMRKLVSFIFNSRMGN